MSELNKTIIQASNKKKFKEGYFIYEYILFKNDNNNLIEDLKEAERQHSELQWNVYNNGKPPEKYYRLVFQTENGELKFL